MKNVTALALACLLIIAACSKGDRIVAEVNGYAIHANDLEAALVQEKTKYDSVLIESPNMLEELERQTMEMLIQEAILLGEAKRLGIDVTDEEVEARLESNFGTTDTSKIESTLEKHGVNADHWFKGLRNKLIIAKLVQREVIDTIPVTEKEVAAYYNKNSKDYRQPVQYRARQMLVDSRSRADEIVKRLATGEDFGELARAYSVSPDAERGGDIGFFSTKGFPAVFSEICASLKKGEVSEVKKTDYGYQIFKLLDRRPPRTQPLKEVKAEIADLIRHERSKDAFSLWFEDLRSKATITITERKPQEAKPNAPKS